MRAPFAARWISSPRLSYPREPSTNEVDLPHAALSRAKRPRPFRASSACWLFRRLLRLLGLLAGGIEAVAQPVGARVGEVPALLRFMHARLGMVGLRLGNAPVGVGGVRTSLRDLCPLAQRLDLAGMGLADGRERGLEGRTDPRYVR